ncbi:MAG TPA: hypothetical protein PJ982_11770, partial [Lacipirellulaceae bacterium]|nr:hypothetical protein [Lacipirellulaceae bacterium]
MQEDPAIAAEVNATRAGAAGRGATPRAAAMLLGGAALAGASLLFLVQPMIARRILPWFGGSAAVWTTAMVFFQTALLVGYAYAHASVRSLALRRQVIVQAALLTGAVALAWTVGVVPTESWKPATADLPTLRVLAILSASVGLPFVCLAATAPLVQAWFARCQPGRSPYGLYALSNFGSLAALASYPMIVERRLGVVDQGVAWSTLFGAFAVLCVVSGVWAIRCAATADGDLLRAGTASGDNGPSPTPPDPRPL